MAREQLSGTAGLDRSPPWLTTAAILAHFGPRKGDARKAYQRFVREGVGSESIWSGLNRQIFLGSDRFVENMQGMLGEECEDLQIPTAQRRRPPPSLEELSLHTASRNAAIVAAYDTGGYSYAEIGTFFGLHLATVGRIVRKAKGGYGNNCEG